MGHLTLIAFPTLRNLTKSLGPRTRSFDFLEKMEPIHIITGAGLVSHLEIAIAEKNMSPFEVLKHLF